MTYIVTWETGQHLPNGVPADDLYMNVEVDGRANLEDRMWDLCQGVYGYVYDLETTTVDLTGRREVIAEHWMTIDRCPTCDVRVILAQKFSNLGRFHVNADRNRNGNLVLTHPNPNGLPIARMLPVAMRFGKFNLRAAHSCQTQRRSRGVHA